MVAKTFGSEVQQSSCPIGSTLYHYSNLHLTPTNNEAVQSNISAAILEPVEPARSKIPIRRKKCAALISFGCLRHSEVGLCRIPHHR